MNPPKKILAIIKTKLNKEEQLLLKEELASYIKINPVLLKIITAYNEEESTSLINKTLSDFFITKKQILISQKEAEEFTEIKNEAKAINKDTKNLHLSLKKIIELIKK